MAYEPTEEGGDTDLRRRAAWLLAMLIVVAILIVVVMTTLLNTDKGSGGSGRTGLGPGAITSTGPPTSPAGTAPRTGKGTTPNGSGTGSSGTTPSTGAGTTAAADPGSATCPTSAPCALDGDVGNAVAAINAFRAAQGKPAVPGAVSEDAKKCALSRGSGCTGGWAETELPAPADGTLAVKRISQFAKFTDPAMKSIAVGWAYNPGTKTYYFATIRKD